MIDIFASKTEDKTTDIVIEYIRYMSNMTIQRVIGDSYSHINFEIDNFKQNLKIGQSNQNNINLNLNTAWLRRGLISINLPFSKDTHNEKINTHISEEMNSLKEFMYDYTLKLGSYVKEIHNNRLTNLILAKQCGFAIPPTLVTTSKSELKKFYKKYERIISKPIHNGHLSFEKGGSSYSCKGTLIFEESSLKSIEEQFCASLFQAYIEKEIELRVFYLNGQLFPMAIFSQLDEKTKFDYRNYNYVKPNRNVPFKFSKVNEEKIHIFMDKINLKTGSIDIILTPDNKLYFLEINPTGQFGWVSYECNYYLEKEIAKYLIENEA